MNKQRAINLYRYLQETNAEPDIIENVLQRLQTDHHISREDIIPKRKKQTVSPNRFDINNYGAGGSRTMNQTRSMQ